MSCRWNGIKIEIALKALRSRNALAESIPRTHTNTHISRPEKDNKLSSWAYYYCYHSACVWMSMYVCRNFSFFHHYGPSTSFASQSSLGIIMENSTTIESHHLAQLPRRSQSLKNRSEYEQLDGDYEDDNTNGSVGGSGGGGDGGGIGGGGRSSSCSSGKNVEDNPNKYGTMKGGSRGWRNVRAVMAYYLTLRKIKRNGASLLFS